MNKKAILMFLVVFSFVSCTKTIEFTGEQTEPLLVVNGIEVVGGNPNLIVDKSHFFLGNNDDTYVKGVAVKLFVNDVFVEDLVVRDTSFLVTSQEGFDSQHSTVTATYCHGNYVFKAGDKVRFEIASDEFEPASASVIMPEQPVISAFDTVKMVRYYWPSYQENPEQYTYTDSQGNPCSLNPYSIFDDDGNYIETLYDTIRPGDLNYVDVYFRLRIDDAEGAHYYNIFPTNGAAFGFSSADPVFSDQMGMEQLSGEEYIGNEIRNVFSDYLFSNRQYDLQFHFDWRHFFGEDNEFEIALQLVDEGYFKYVTTKGQGSGSLPSGISYLFSEPKQVYSNVEGGTGVVAAKGEPVKASVVVSMEK